MESYILSFSKDRKNWKLYKDAASKERKVGVLLNAFTVLFKAVDMQMLTHFGLCGS